MSEEPRDDVRNIAIVAHVDHGKTTLVDAMLWQSAFFRDAAAEPVRLPEGVDLGREKSITVMAKITSLVFRGTRINIVDTPSRADFGGEVERALKMVEGVLLLVDACEGPLPQSRFVLRKAIEAGFAPIVVLTKVDRPEARPAEVLRELREMLLDLDADEEQSAFPVLYCNALRGLSRREPGAPDESLLPLFELILAHVPPPRHDPRAPLQFLVTMLDYDDYLGRLALGRVFNGTLVRGRGLVRCRLDGQVDAQAAAGLIGFDGLRRVEIDSAGPGDIVAVTGLAAVAIGETLSDPDRPAALPPLRIDAPTLAIVLSVNDSPMAGLEGEHVAAGRLRERLWREILTNAAIRVEETDSPDAFELSGRDELQLAIVVEMMRREGFELLVGKPRVLTREERDRRLEPMELLVVDCPEEYSGVVTEKAGARKGRMTKMINHGAGRVRMEFRIPSRGLIGFRAEFLSDTRGAGILNHQFDGYDAWAGEIAGRSTGVLVADRPGRATASALEHLQHRGTIFIAPGDQVYEGMIVGENSRSNDLPVNVIKEKRPAGPAPEAAKQPVRLIPPRLMNLEQALEFIRDDELVEATPRALRLRKRVLPGSLR